MNCRRDFQPAFYRAPHDFCLVHYPIRLYKLISLQRCWLNITSVIWIFKREFYLLSEFVYRNSVCHTLLKITEPFTLSFERSQQILRIILLYATQRELFQEKHNGRNLFKYRSERVRYIGKERE